jgi:ribosomal-protein-alanine N-acetyltransferase
VSAELPSIEEVRIRALGVDDIADVAAIHVAAFAESEPEALSRAIASLHEELGRAWAHVRVALRGGACLGASVVWVVADELHVLDVATHPAHRREGVGRTLVRDILALAKDRRARHLYLEVRRSNVAAITLYRSAGFAAVGVRRRYYSDDEDAIEMSLEIEPETGDVVGRADEVEITPRS